MSVVGIDIGNLFSKVSVAHKQAISMVPNEISKLYTHSLVGFTEKERHLGEPAVSSLKRNFKNTIPMVKRFLGRSHSDPDVIGEASTWTQCELARVEETGSIGFKVNTSEGINILAPEQILSGFLRQLKSITSAYLEGIPVKDCVITCPAYFDDAQRRAMLRAARLAELNVLRLMNESTAIALNYGILRSLPKDTTRRVVFVDIGYASTQVCIVDFVSGKLQTFVNNGNANVGARDFDMALYDFFRKQFLESSKIDLNAPDKARSKIRMLSEVARVKKMLSANKDAVLPIDCLVDDIDFTCRITRDEFEGLVVDQLRGIGDALKDSLAQMRHKDELVQQRVQKELESSGKKGKGKSGGDKAANVPSAPEIHSVEIVGGGSRIPCIQETLMRVLKENSLTKHIEKFMTTLNGDECVARGAALMCAMLSPNFKVKDFEVQDINNWPVSLKYERDDSKKSDSGENESKESPSSAPHSKDGQVVLNRGDPCPCSAKVTLHNKSKEGSFEFFLNHAMEVKKDDIHTKYEYPFKTNLSIGKFTLNVATPSKNLVSEPKIKMMLGLNKHGVLDFPRATLIEYVKRTESTPATPVEKADDKKTDEKGGDKMDVDTPASSDNGGGDSGGSATPSVDEDVEMTDKSSAPESAPSSETPAQKKDDKKAEKSATDDDKKKSSEKPSTTADKKKEPAPTKKKKTKKRVVRDLKITGSFSNDVDRSIFNAWMETEAKFCNSDRIVRETNEKRNEVESYVYEMRDKLDGSHREFVDEEGRLKLNGRLNQVEDWLYDEGENANKSEYSDKLKELQSLGGPILSRAWEAEHRTNRVEQLKKLVIRYNKFADTSDEKYAHISVDQRNQVRGYATKVDEWLVNRMIKQDKLKPYEKPAVMCSEIDKKYKQLLDQCQPIVTTPKPKPKPVEEKKDDKKEENRTDDKDSKKDESSEKKPEESQKPDAGKESSDDKGKSEESSTKSDKGDAEKPSEKAKESEATA